MAESPRPEDHKFIIAEVLKSVGARLSEGRPIIPVIYAFAFGWAGDIRKVTGAHIESDQADPSMIREVLDPMSPLYARIEDTIGIGPETAVYCQRGDYYCGDPVALENWTAPEAPTLHDAIVIYSNCTKAQLVAIAPIYADERTLGPAQVYLNTIEGLEPLGLVAVNRLEFVLDPMTVLPAMSFRDLP